MKEEVNEFSIIEGVIGYFIGILICYLLARLFFYILWKKYNGDECDLRYKTVYFFEDYNSVMRFCKVSIVLSFIPFVNIFIAISLMLINIGILAFHISDKMMSFSWITDKKTKEYYD